MCVCVKMFLIGTQHFIHSLNLRKWQQKLKTGYHTNALTHMYAKREVGKNLGKKIATTLLKYQDL